MNPRDFKDILSEATQRYRDGEELETILADYPAYAEELRVLLHAAARKESARLGDLIHGSAADDKPKHTPKRKPTAPTRRRWQRSGVLLGLVVALLLGALLGGVVYRQRTVVPTPHYTVNATAYAQVAYANGACASLEYTPQPITNNQQQNVARDEGGYGGGGADTASMEEPAAVDSASDDGAALGGLGGGDADEAEFDAESRDDTAVTVPEGAPPVATSVASDDIRSAGTATPLPTMEPTAPDTSSSVEEAEADDASEAEELPAVEAQQPLEPLQAGEIDDNADWDTYQEYRNNYLNQYGTYMINDVDTTDRKLIRVLDENGLPLQGACVQVFHGESLIDETLTYATGLTMFFPNLRETTRYVNSFRVVVTQGQTVQETTLDREELGDVVTVELPIEPQQAQTQLDVLFLLDATGSMADEIAQLQDNILSISAQIDALPGAVDVRYGLVSYRDRGDAYVTRFFDFTADVTAFQRELSRVVAAGGGDYPEALNEGLDVALNAADWRGPHAVKLVFLVADAPPHIDYQDDTQYDVLMRQALGRGIKIHPIASSGLQPEGEYILRQIGQFTMGHFVFLTYEDSVPGTPGAEREDLDVGDPEDEQGVGDYSVSQLDELVLRLITDELAALRGE